jgi:hypothetical protein
MEGTMQDPPNTLHIGPSDTAWIHVLEPVDPDSPEVPLIHVYRLEADDLIALRALRALRRYLKEATP